MIKAIRLSFKDLQSWILETDIQVALGQLNVDHKMSVCNCLCQSQVVHLVRDPRAILSSRGQHGGGSVVGSKANCNFFL